ncbi:VOC family protein [Streptomyces sp. NPDC026665]|uniref:VOC family protein n=1 Tax=Streptomyces sp. NPDC026665 TaxID=3154798 RepID=UPI0033C234D8
MSTIHALGYLVVRGSVAEWRRYGTEILGVQVGTGSTDGELRLRMDDRAYRILVEDGEPGGPASLVALGFETANGPALDALAEHLRGQGVEVTEDADLAARRQVRRLLTFKDFDGNTLEAYYGQHTDHRAFVSPRGVRFVTGDMGVGHTFLTSSDAAKAAAWYTDVLGFRLSDTIDFGFAEGIFLHCNSRHHTVAFATFPGAPSGIGHLMIEVDSLDAVGRALDLVADSPEALTMAMGEHTNDKMTSFYVKTPSGFDIEYGWNGLLIDDDEWTVGHYSSPSNWGHKFQTPPAPPAEPADTQTPTSR